MKMIEYAVINDPIFKNVAGMSYDDVVEMLSSDSRFEIEEEDVAGFRFTNEAWPDIVIDVDVRMQAFLPPRLMIFYVKEHNPELTILTAVLKD